MGAILDSSAKRELVLKIEIGGKVFSGDDQKRLIHTQTKKIRSSSFSHTYNSSSADK